METAQEWGEAVGAALERLRSVTQEVRIAQTDDGWTISIGTVRVVVERRESIGGPAGHLVTITGPEGIGMLPFGTSDQTIDAVEEEFRRHGVVVNLSNAG